jgi:transcriptional regulator with XRE-family HTH domain
MVLSMENIREFLEFQMGKRGWKQADLARASNLDSAVISNIINGRRRMGEETGRAIAQALHLPAEEVFRAAGLLPPETKNDPLTDEAEYLLSQLPENKRQQALAFIRFLANENYSPAGMEQAKPETP